jgi:hypothetical protein
MAAFLIDEQNRILSQDSLSRSRRSAELFYRRQPHDGTKRTAVKGWQIARWRPPRLELNPFSVHIRQPTEAHFDTDPAVFSMRLSRECPVAEGRPFFGHLPVTSW